MRKLNACGGPRAPVRAPRPQTPLAPLAAGCVPPRYHAVCAWPGELRRLGRTVGRAMGAVVGAVQCHRPHRYRGQRCKPAIDLGIGGVSLDCAESVAERMDGDIDVVGVVERSGGARKGRVVEAPGRGPLLPEEPVHLAAVLCVAGAPSLGLEVELPPERNLAFGQRRNQCRGRFREGIAVARHQARAALGPEGGHGAGRLAAPVVSRQHRTRQRQCIEQRQQVRAECREFARTQRACIQEARGAEAAQIGNDHAATRGREEGATSAYASMSYGKP